MATKTSAVMTVTDAAGTKSISRSITDVNPAAEPVDIANFVKALNGLTNNTLVSIELVTKTDITNVKRDPQLTVTPNTAVLEAAAITFNVSYRGDGTITLSGKKPIDATGGLTYNAGNKQIVNNEVEGIVLVGGDTFVTTIELSETDDYAGATATITWTNANAAQFVDI